MAAEEARSSFVERVQVKGPMNRGKRRDDARLTSLEEAVEEAQLVVGRLSERVEELVQDSSEITAVTKEMIKELGWTISKEVSTLFDEVAKLRKFVEGELHELRGKVHNTRKECQANHSANGGTSTSTTSSIAHATCGVKVPKPYTYEGTRSVTVVENFLFGLEQYFEALGTSSMMALRLQMLLTSYVRQPNYGGVESTLSVSWTDATFERGNKSSQNF